LPRFAYIGLLAGALLLGIALSWTTFGQQIDSNAYDFIFRVYQPAPWTPESIILAADEESFSAFGGLLKLRRALADGLARIEGVHPRAVAVDIILSEAQDPAADQALENAFRATPNLILPSDLIQGGERWDDPLPRFRQFAAAVGHIQADLDPFDAISRDIPLEKATAHSRHWALSLEAFRVSRNARIEESPDDLRVGSTVIPSARRNGRTIRIRYAPFSMAPLPRISLKQLADNPHLAESFRGKVVFVGVTAQTAVRDRWMTPLSSSVSMPGIEMHASAFETMAHGLFLTDVPLSLVVLACALIVIAAGVTFATLEGWAANIVGALILVCAHVLPYVMFTRNLVFPLLPGVACAWMSCLAAAAWQHVAVRRRLGHSETAQSQYREAMQFVTHEMKTPLTAIQGSSELMGRYALPEDKRKQMANMINSESKRLAQMIETFLNVERLSAGQMELKQEQFSSEEIVSRCVERVRPVADRKAIAIHMDPLPPEPLTGDRELMEYAFYNLLTNAVKYSPPDTCVTVSGDKQNGRIRVSVADQGIGIDPKDAKRIFEKFYRTKTAEQSNEKGTGIGLSIVEQIVIQHGGSIAVSSEVGKGSKFTVSLPAGQSPL